MAVDMLWNLLAAIGLVAEELGAGKLFWRAIDWTDRRQRRGASSKENRNSQHDEKGSHAG